MQITAIRPLAVSRFFLRGVTLEGSRTLRELTLAER